MSFCRYLHIFRNAMTVGVVAARHLHRRRLPRQRRLVAASLRQAGSHCGQADLLPNLPAVTNRCALEPPLGAVNAWCWTIADAAQKGDSALLAARDRQWRRFRGSPGANQIKFVTAACETGLVGALEEERS